ncbi:hypothetical protein Terro_1672 [Terriglobus roseus DSM 18391]|uniref:DUF5666 domain-containing protein n=1 Tax=Terriglobus roseus (strain DSM 18391 / NRRL B-41598 / KBS 63) TaxID=926566 RepID=I3ZFF7_TERRK|nr:hypothetical protein Terro_1672 [Terriglobus roseus DSM 18391]
MYIPSSLRVTALGLAIGSTACAQGPVPALPPPPTGPAGASSALAPTQLPLVTESSRVRAFNVGPDGEVHSVYLRNGSVVALSPALGGQVGRAIRKGEKITVTGTRSEINGQRSVEAASVRLNDQTFVAGNTMYAPAGPNGVGQEIAPPPPNGPQAPPSPARRRRAADGPPAPYGVPAGAPAPLAGPNAPPPPAAPGSPAPVAGPGGPPPPAGPSVPPLPPPDGAAPPPPPANGMTPPPPPMQN